MKPQEPKEEKPLAPELLEKLEPADHLDRLRTIGLPVVLAISIGVALALTVISIGMYYSSNLSRIDLSKPKYADIRQDVLEGRGDQSDEALDRDSPITREAVKKAIADMKKRREDLHQLGGFDTSILNDAPLGIGAQ